MTAPQKNSIRAKLISLLARHGRMDAILPGLIAARGHHATVLRTANDHRLADQVGVKSTLHRHKERVKIDVYDMSFQFHLTNLNNHLTKC